MNSISRQSTPLRFAAFACFTATTLAFSPNTSIFSDMVMGGENLGAFIFPMFIAACIGAGLLIAFLHGRDAERYRRFPLLVTAAVLHIAAVCVFIGCNYGLSVPALALHAIGALYGLTLVIICLAWAALLGTIGFRRAVLCATLTCMGSYILSAMLGILPQAWRWIPYLVLFCIGSLGPCVFLHPTRQVAANRPEDASAPEADAEEQPHVNTADLLRSLRLPGLGMLLFAFLMALNKTRMFNLVESEYVAGIIAGLCFLAVFAARKEVLLPSFLYRVVAPTIGGIVVVFLAVSGQLETNDVAYTVVYVFLSALAILAFANALTIINAGEFSAEFVESIGLLAGFGVSLVGIVWSRTYGGPENVSTVVFVLIALYCACMMVYLGWESWRLMNRPEEEREEVPAPAEDWQARAEAAKLSKREIDILSYLGRGHSSMYIAEQLFISESTVRTHAKHIYAKLGIHSKEELFAFIDGK